MEYYEQNKNNFKRGMGGEWAIGFFGARPTRFKYQRFSGERCVAASFCNAEAHTQLERRAYVITAPSWCLYPGSNRRLEKISQPLRYSITIIDLTFPDHEHIPT